MKEEEQKGITFRRKRQIPFILWDSSGKYYLEVAAENKESAKEFMFRFNPKSEFEGVASSPRENMLGIYVFRFRRR